MTFFIHPKLIKSELNLKKFKKRFDLSFLCVAKWYLGMRIRNRNDHISIAQDQYEIFGIRKL